MSSHNERSVLGLNDPEINKRGQEIIEAEEAKHLDDILRAPCDDRELRTTSHLRDAEVPDLPTPINNPPAPTPAAARVWWDL